MRQFVALVDEIQNIETAKKGGADLWAQQAESRIVHELEVEGQIEGLT